MRLGGFRWLAWVVTGCGFCRGLIVVLSLTLIKSPARVGSTSWSSKSHLSIQDWGRQSPHSLLTPISAVVGSRLHVAFSWRLIQTCLGCRNLASFSCLGSPSKSAWWSQTHCFWSGKKCFSGLWTRWLLWRTLLSRCLLVWSWTS